jgi:hypothetical protein
MADEYRGLIGDLEAEHADLDAVMAPISEAEWSTLTPADGWTVGDSILHLALTDEVAALAADPVAFEAYRAQRRAGGDAFETHPMRVAEASKVLLDAQGDILPAERLPCQLNDYLVSSDPLGEPSLAPSLSRCFLLVWRNVMGRDGMHITRRNVLALRIRAAANGLDVSCQSPAHTRVAPTPVAASGAPPAPGLTCSMMLQVLRGRQ